MFLGRFFANPAGSYRCNVSPFSDNVRKSDKMGRLCSFALLKVSLSFPELPSVFCFFGLGCLTSSLVRLHAGAHS